MHKGIPPEMKPCLGQLRSNTVEEKVIETMAFAMYRMANVFATFRDRQQW
jgi:hypothetical protein